MKYDAVAQRSITYHFLAKNGKGFTLIEVILYVSLAAIILSAVSFLYAVVVSNDAHNSVRVSVDESSFHVLRIVGDAIRHATSVTEPTAQSESDRLELVMADPELDPTIITVSGGYVEIQEGGEAPIQISASNVFVDGAEFSNRSNTETSGTVHVEFTTTYRDESGRSELEYSATYYGSATTR